MVRHSWYAIKPNQTGRIILFLFLFFLLPKGKIIFIFKYLCEIWNSVIFFFFFFCGGVFFEEEKAVAFRH